MAFSTNLAGTNMEGVDSAQRFALGTRSLASDGSEWMYVKSGAAITAYDTLWINSSFVAAAITPALAITAGDVGFAGAVSCSTSGQYFWTMVRGNPTVRLAANCQPAVPLYTTDTAGVLDDATASLSQHQVQGVIATTSNSAASSSVGNISVVANFPVIRRPAV
jgi:hypothetical protein